MLECTAINVNGLDLISSTYYFTLDGLFSNTNDVIMNDLYGDGQAYDHTKFQVKVPLLNGFVKTRNANDFMYLRQILCAKGLKTFTISMPQFEELTFQAEITNWGMGSIGSFTIACTLVLTDPYVYSLNSQTLGLDAVANSSLEFPFAFPINFGTVTGAAGIVNNVGNTIAYPVIEIIGACSTLEVTNITTGESMSIAVTLADTDVLIIDSNPVTRSIMLNGVLRMDLKNGNWFTCPVGNSSFIFSRNSIESKQHCSVQLQNRYI